jgi:hypothetical protein
MSADIIQLIPRPRHAFEQADFPTIAFRSVVRDLATDLAEPKLSEFCEPDERET